MCRVSQNITTHAKSHVSLFNPKCLHLSPGNWLICVGVTVLSTEINRSCTLNEHDCRYRERLYQFAQLKHRCGPSVLRFRRYNNHYSFTTHPLYIISVMHTVETKCLKLLQSLLFFPCLCLTCFYSESGKNNTIYPLRHTIKL